MTMIDVSAIELEKAHALQKRAMENPLPVDIFYFTFTEDRPALNLDGRKLTWDLRKELNGEFDSVAVLKDGDDILMYVPYCTCIQTFDFGKKLIVFRHDWRKPALEIQIFHTSELRPLMISEKEVKEKFGSNSQIVVTSETKNKFRIDVPSNTNAQKVSVPLEFHGLGEILGIVKAPWLKEDDKNFESMCILSIDTKTEICQVYPLDWFNQGAFDHGYQWPAVVARDPETKFFWGYGVRIGGFICDETGKKRIL